MKNLSIKMKVLGISVLMMIVSLGIFTVTHIVHANPSNFPKQYSTSTASSTPSYFAVTATSTIVIDAYQVAGTQLNTNKYDSATVAVQFIATTSATSILGWRYEYAVDQPGIDCSVTQLACDWYSDNLFSVSTSTQNFTLGAGTTYQWAFSSSTDFCNTSDVIATRNRGCKLINVPTPTRYTRILFYRHPSATTNGAVWATLVPVREVKN